MTKLLTAAWALGFVLASTPLQPLSAVSEGSYKLHNHPDGSIAPPSYGLRLDYLYNIRGDRHEEFTFDFDHEDSAMFLDFSGSTIHIHGTAFGGYDIGTTYDSDLSGLWNIDFTYENVTSSPGDDDATVLAPNSPVNTGTIEALFSSSDKLIKDGDLFYLAEYAGDFDYTFRFGDENNDLGHRDYEGISGWGWLNVDDKLKDLLKSPEHRASQDWLFAATPVPEPSTYLSLGTLLALIGFVYMRKKNAEKVHVRK